MRKILLYCLLLLCSLNVMANTRVIKGVVSSATDHLPLPGATVLEVGTRNGVSTNLNGEFELTVNKKKDTYLEISFLGMKTKRLKLEKNKDYYSIELEDDDVLLEEVMISTAYESRSQRRETGAVSRIEISEMRGDADRGTPLALQDVYGKNNKKTPEGSTETWKKSTLKDNAMRLEIGDNEFLPLEDVQIALQIEGNRIRVLIDAYFYNDKSQSGLEGTFKLKLPVDASPYYFAFGGTALFDQDKKGKNTIPVAQLHDYSKDNFDLSAVGIQQRNDQKATKQAKITEKETAADAYFTTIARKIDPALMEWSGADMFSCRVFPIQANQLHHIVIGYDVDMIEGLDFRTFTLGLPEAKNKLRVDLVVADDNAYVITPKQEAISQKNKEKQYLTYFNPTAKEINVKWNSVKPLVLLQQNKEGDYFAGTMRIQLPREVDATMAKEAVFMLDTSLSSNPVLFGVWVNLVQEILTQNEGVIERFALLNFNMGTQWYQEKWMSNTTKNREDLVRYMNTLALEGATDLGRALQEASHPTWLKPQVAKSLFLLSDGDLNWGVNHRELLANYLYKGDKVYTYKTGMSGTNTDLLDYLSTLTGGSSFTANSEAQLIESAKALRYKTWKLASVFGETATDILLAGGVTQLYDGQILQLAARGNLDKPIQLKVTSGSETKVIEFKPVHQVNSALASRMYGKIALTQLDQIGSDLKSASVDYSIYYQVLSAYTSFLMLETQAEYEAYQVKSLDVAEKFVKEFTVTELLKAFIQTDALTAKKSFEQWVTLLQKQHILQSGDAVLANFISEMTDADFVIQPQSLFKVWEKKKQTKEELDLLGMEEMTLDALQVLAAKRAKTHSEADALKLLSSIIERNGSDVDVLRDLLTNTLNLNYGYDSYYLGQKILDTRINDCLVYFNMARALEQNNPKLAAIFYYISSSAVFKTTNYGSIRAINGLFANRFLQDRAKTNKRESVKEKMFFQQLQAQAQKDYASYYEANYTSDLVVLVYWNLDSTDIDLHIKEASNEECSYNNKRTKLGGILSEDVTRGFGPEMYILPQAKAGKYEISLNYFAESDRRTKSAAKAYIEVYKYFGTDKQEVSKKTVLLKERKSKEVIETVVFR